MQEFVFVAVHQELHKLQQAELEARARRQRLISAATAAATAEQRTGQPRRLLLPRLFRPLARVT